MGRAGCSIERLCSVIDPPQDVAYRPRCPVDIIEESQPLEVAKYLVRHGKKVRPLTLFWGSGFRFRLQIKMKIALPQAPSYKIINETSDILEPEKNRFVSRYC